MNKTISLIVGDWSNDGHEQTSNITIRSNLTKEEIEESVKFGISKLKINPLRDFEGYQENSFTNKTLSVLFNTFGFDVIVNNLDLDIKNYNENKLYTEKELRTISKIVVIDDMQYAKLYLLLAQHGNPIFQYELVEDEIPSINIGGYGLFSN